MGGRLSAYLFGYEEIRALILGLDASGKTTLLYRMKLGEVVTTIPTIGFNVETLQHKKLTITAWDIGGRSQRRPLLRHYFQNTHALVFMVDSRDKDRMSEVAEELSSLLTEDELREAVILVLANKQDLEGCLSAEEVSQKLQFQEITRGRDAAIFPISATENTGTTEAFDWLEEKFAAHRAEKYLTNRVLSRVSCNAFKKAWSVNSLLKTTMSSAKGLLSSWTNQKDGGDLTQTDH